jgi:hypothetical protein
MSACAWSDAASRHDDPIAAKRYTDCVNRRAVIEMRERSQEIVRTPQSFAEIARRLNEDGPPTAHPPTLWHPATVKKVVDRAS